jgi:C4-dicarboxylate-specific signal transduction histidine kinase
MAGQLRQSFIALENSNAELEARVEERTVELKTANSYNFNFSPRIE